MDPADNMLPEKVTTVILLHLGSTFSVLKYSGWYANKPVWKD